MTSFSPRCPSTTNLLSADCSDGAAPDLTADLEPELSTRLQRAQECLQLLHSDLVD